MKTKYARMKFVGTTKDDGIITHRLAQRNLKIGDVYIVCKHNTVDCSVNINGFPIFLPIHSFREDLGEKYGLV